METGYYTPMRIFEICTIYLIDRYRRYTGSAKMMVTKV